MSFIFLADQLREIADKAIIHFRDEYGVAVRKFKIERPLDKVAFYRPTAYAEAADHNIFCLEVREDPYTNALDKFVLECRRECLPVKLYIIMPANSATGLDYQQKLKDAYKNGLGIVIFGPQGVDTLREAISQDLMDLRQPNIRDYPFKYRQSLKDAISTYSNGNPSKGCSVLYDEIEDLSRKIALVTKKLNLWRIPLHGKVPSDKSIEKMSWTKLTEFLIDRLNFSALQRKCPNLDRRIISKVYGITKERNESGHKPKNINQLIDRNRKLRTRFENAADLLKDLIVTSKCLKV